MVHATENAVHEISLTLLKQVFYIQGSTSKPGSFFRQVENVADTDACMTLCMQNEKCVAFNYVGEQKDWNSRRCFLHTKVNSPSIALQQFFTVSENTDRPGEVIEKDENVKTVDACMIRCVMNPSCVAFNYVRSKTSGNYRTCSLNAEVHPTRSAPGMISGLLLEREKLPDLLTTQEITTRPVPAAVLVDNAGHVDACQAAVLNAEKTLSFSSVGMGTTGKAPRCLLSADLKPPESVSSATTRHKLVSCFLNAEVHPARAIPDITSGILDVERPDKEEDPPQSDAPPKKLGTEHRRTLKMIRTRLRHIKQCLRRSQVQVVSVRSRRRWMMWEALRHG